VAKGNGKGSFEPTHPAWGPVDALIARATADAGRVLISTAEDARLVTALGRRGAEDGDEAARLAVEVAATEGNRRRIYDLNHAAKGRATWFDKQGQAFKRTGQFPLTVRVWRAGDGGEGDWAEVRVPDLTRDELAAWIRLREEHLAGERLNLDVFRELLRLWIEKHPTAATLSAMCAAAGLDLLDLRFTA